MANKRFGDVLDCFWSFRCRLIERFSRVLKKKFFNFFFRDISFCGALCNSSATSGTHIRTNMAATFTILFFSSSEFPMRMMFSIPHPRWFTWNPMCGCICGEWRPFFFQLVELSIGRWNLSEVAEEIGINGNWKWLGNNAQVFRRPRRSN